MNYSKVNWNLLFSLFSTNWLRNTSHYNYETLLKLSKHDSFQRNTFSFLELNKNQPIEPINISPIFLNNYSFQKAKRFPLSINFLTSSFTNHSGWLKFDLVGMNSFKIKPIISVWLLWEKFLDNFFINGGSIWHFPTPLLTEEVNAINYSLLTPPSSSFFPLSHPFFFFKFKRFSESESFFFEKFKLNDGVIIFFTDITTHLFRFKPISNSFFFTAGLTDPNQHPWLFNFSLPISNNSLSAKFFCLKLSLQKKKNSVLSKHILQHNYWKTIQTLPTSLV